MKAFGKKIIDWYEKNKRDLPWRKTKDPYKIWLSEVILQQTRVDQGMSYYLKFIQNYPTVKDLAKAKEDDVLKLWQGLGYYSRARNLHAAAKDVVQRFKGVFPKNYDDIRSLKGVGDYTAAAIASFAYDLPYAVVDGNVYRVLSRYAGIATPIDTSAGKKEFADLAFELLSNHSPHNFNQAIMEIGALQCKPSNPDCSECPLMTSCFAFENGKIDSLPVKSKKIKIRKRYFHYLVIGDGKDFFIRKRIEKDIWTGLHDFPLIESDNSLPLDELIKTAEWKKHFGKKKMQVKKVSTEHKHLLSHQHIHATFYEIHTELKTFKEENKEWKKVNSTNFYDYAVPKLIEEYFGKK